jgi:hypothetical protein
VSQRIQKLKKNIYWTFQKSSFTGLFEW